MSSDELDPTSASDFYGFTDLLDDEGRALVERVRAFCAERVAPIITEHWINGTFPHELIEPLGELGVAGLTLHGYGCPGRSHLLDGLLALELGRADPSIATFHGVHGGLAMGSVYYCGDETQKQQWLPPMAKWKVLGAFGLTEPDVGSGVSGGLTTTAQPDGDEWILNGEKKWIGNATFSDITVIWARSLADNQVKGFVVRNDSPGFTAEKIEDKIALRVVQNAHIILRDVRVSEADRLQNANSFRDTAKVLRATRAGVAWMAVGCMLGAYEHSLAYAKSRQQFGRPIAGFQLVQDLLVRQLGNITASAAMCVQLARLQDEGRAKDEHSALAKSFCTVRMREAVGWARELMGGNGILLEHQVGRFVADAEAIYSYEGTREINSLIVGRAITGLSAFV